MIHKYAVLNALQIYNKVRLWWHHPPQKGVVNGFLMNNLRVATLLSFQKVLQINQGPSTIAAIMVESIPGSAGVLIPAVGFMEGRGISRCLGDGLR